MDQSLEEWRPVVGYEDLYEVSNLGQVRSLPRVVRWKTRWGSYGTRTNPLALRKLTTDTYGYLCVSMKRYGKSANPRVHKLVAKAFLGERPDWASQINHIDRCRTNNCVGNLEWSYPAHNNRHANAKHEWEGKLLCL